MKSLFDASHNKEIIDRINSLSHTSQAEWGKMNVPQMLAHCQAPLNVAYGELKLKRGLMGILFGTLIKNKLTKDERPFDRSLPTDKAFIVNSQQEFEIEKNKLIKAVKKFEDIGPAGITKDAHPFFGKISAAEWDILQWKHLDHHLRQFGA